MAALPTQSVLWFEHSNIDAIDNEFETMLIRVTNARELVRDAMMHSECGGGQQVTSQKNTQALECTQIWPD
eukprot:m.636316 g.636316  ORF g.636316 m.636316 type:complete len:71 (+) comp22591_c0_seq1:3324-3536(+)